jgi:hypothetical protein
MSIKTWLFVGLFLPLIGWAQSNGYDQLGEFGFQVGGAHYFGDLNTKSRLNRPGITAGIFFRKQFNNYVALRVGGNYAHLEYNDRISGNNAYQRRRNLSFGTNIWEFIVQGDFNFFRYNPDVPGERLTPYLTFGLGLFSYDPYAYFEGEKYFLRTIGTEGQGSDVYPSRKLYGTTALAVPVGLGVKFSLSERVNLNFEVTHRFTTTDYVDDVSTTYAGPAAFAPGSPAAYLQDRSYETGNPIGVAGMQRGFSGKKDQYVLAVMGITFNLTRYKCPSATW